MGLMGHRTVEGEDLTLPTSSKSRGHLLSRVRDVQVFVAEAIKAGIDLVDISSGGNDPHQQIHTHPSYQVSYD